MLKEKIEADIRKATLENDGLSKGILKVVLGDVQLQEVRLGKSASDDDVLRVIRKTAEGLRENIAAREKFQTDARLDAERAELGILEKMLPKEADASEIMLILMAEGARLQVFAAKSDGQATGIAMKLLKEAGLTVNGKLVQKAVTEIRIPK